MGGCQTRSGGLSASAFPLELGPGPPWRGAADRLSPHCQDLAPWGLWQREGKYNWADGQALTRPAAPVQPGEQEATVARGRACPFTRGCAAGEQRSCLTDSGSAELSEGARAGTDVCMWFCLGLGVWAP